MEFLSDIGSAFAEAVTAIISTEVPGALLVLSVIINIVLVYRYVRLALKKGNEQ